MNNSLNITSENRVARIGSEFKEVIANFSTGDFLEAIIISLEITILYPIKQLGKFICNIFRGIVKESIAFSKSLIRGEGLEYLKSIQQRVTVSLERILGFRDCALALWRVYRNSSIEQRRYLIIRLIFGVLGFLFIGGTGTGGFIDSDIRFRGIGNHRSLFFHSIIPALIIEFVLILMVVLDEMAHMKLPVAHDPVWDASRELIRAGSGGFITGSWVGSSTHLLIDANGGFTPYKDLPFPMSMSSHKLLMNSFATLAGFQAVRARCWGQAESS